MEIEVELQVGKSPISPILVIAGHHRILKVKRKDVLCVVVTFFVKL
jgi:hypothetical protein